MGWPVFRSTLSATNLSMASEMRTASAREPRMNGRSRLPWSAQRARCTAVIAPDRCASPSSRSFGVSVWKRPSRSRSGWLTLTCGPPVARSGQVTSMVAVAPSTWAPANGWALTSSLALAEPFREKVNSPAAAPSAPSSRRSSLPSPSGSEAAEVIVEVKESDDPADRSTPRMPKAAEGLAPATSRPSACTVTTASLPSHADPVAGS